MQIIRGSQPQVITHDLVDRITGADLTGGTAQFYVRALSGINADKWYRGSDDSWQADRSVAGDGVYSGAGAEWTLTLLAGALTEVNRYSSTATHSGGNQYNIVDQVFMENAGVGIGSLTVTITVTDENNNPLDGVAVWVSTDQLGANVVTGTYWTNAMGIVLFKLDPGVYWCHKQLSGYNFDPNPAPITVS